MASVTLDAIWLHLAEDPSVRFRFDAHQLSVRETDTGNEVRRYGTGRLRAVSSPHTVNTTQVSLGYEDRDKFDAMRATWLKRPVMYRDLKGRKVFGLLTSVVEEDFGHGRTEARWSFTIAEFSYAEEV